jgi:predicted RNase H-like nuclease
VAVVGIDACRGGWVAVVLGDDEAPRALLLGELTDLAAEVPAPDAVGIDIPIGLPPAGHRQADLDARALLGPRRMSVFLTPPRPVLEAVTHAEATALSTRLSGVGVSVQAYGLRHRIFEAEAWIAGPDAPPVWEVHPEVSFTRMLGQPPTATKKVWAGVAERVGALQAHGIDPMALVGTGTGAGTDDVLDAAAVAWSAVRIASGTAVALPDPPERDEASGRDVAIWA